MLFRSHRGELLRGQGGELPREAVAELRQAVGRQGDAHGARMAAEPRKEVRAALHGVEEVHGPHGPARPARLAVGHREDAHNLMDTVRQVLAFTRDQMDNYKDILAFIRDNRENFNLLDEKYKGKVTEIMGLESQPWPVVMSDYLDLKDDLTVALDKIRKQLRDEIKAAYEKAYAELVQGAKDSGVDESVVTNPENIIFSKSQTGNIYALQSNRNVDEYFTAQAAKIQKAKLAATQAAAAANGGGSTSGTGTGASAGTGTSGYSTDYSNDNASHAAEPKVMNLNLVTRTTAVLSNETEVDAYLSSLKKQMMDKIKDGWQLTITQ